MARVGIVGGGISGLLAAYRLQKSGISVELFESSDRVGGVIETTQTEGFLVEHGPNSLRPTPLLETVLSELDLDAARVWASDTANTRYVVRDGRPVSLPMSIGSFLTTDLFSGRAKLRLLAEPFIRARPADAAEESLADFTRRRLGAEVLNYAVAPFVGGVFAGRPDDLSAQHASGRLVDLEREYGSLFWGALRSMGDDEKPETPSGLFSFRDGLETLPQRLAAQVGDAIHLNTRVTALRRDDDNWTVTAAPPADSTRFAPFDAIICTVPLHALSNITLGGTTVDRSPLADTEYPPVHVVALGYERDDVAHPLDGFGMLVPPVEDSFDVLGTIFSSSLFPGRAPNGSVLLTTFVGGARTPSLAERSPSEIQTIVEQDLGRLLGVEGSPSFTHHVHWSQAIPQYTLGYGTVKQTLDQLESERNGLFFAGNYREGVSVGDAMASGASAAERAESMIRGSA